MGVPDGLHDALDADAGGGMGGSAWGSESDGLLQRGHVPNGHDAFEDEDGAQLASGKQWQKKCRWIANTAGKWECAIARFLPQRKQPGSDDERDFRAAEPACVSDPVDARMPPLLRSCGK